MENQGRKITFLQGETIYRVGDTSGQMYVVLHGGIELHGDGGSVEVLLAGGVFGENAVIEPGPRGDRAVAIVDTDVMAIDQTQFLAMVQHTPTFALKLMRVISNRALKRRQPDQASTTDWAAA
jgi:CRP/FNR family transcriptional regulator, cyclic AMP receptor protein